MKYLILISLTLFISKAAIAICAPGFPSSAKTIVIGNVIEKNGHLFILVHKSWFPVPQKIKIIQNSESTLPMAHMFPPLNIKKSDWIFLISNSDLKKGAINVPACGSKVINLNPKSKNFEEELKKANSYIDRLVVRKLGKAKFFPNKK